MPGRVRRRCPACVPGGSSTKSDPVACKVCGTTVAQNPGRGRRLCYCSQTCRIAGRREGECRRVRACKRCGKEFKSGGNKQFCSVRCRWPFRKGEKASCCRCAAVFAKRIRSQRFCSFECNVADASTNLRGALKDKCAAKYKCLNCGCEFQKKTWSRNAGKYCSRGCAFEARRLKKACAQRPLEVAAKLSRWFCSWGDDCWPKQKPCVSCGVVRFQRKGAQEPRDKCRECSRPKERPCRDCGTAIPWVINVRRCPQCRLHRRSAARRRNKKRNGRNIRERARSRNATYTPFPVREIYERDGWVCQWCGVELLRAWKIEGGTVDPRSRTIDHVFPLELGQDGPGHVRHNVVACCHMCNSLKSHKNPLGWACPWPSQSHSFAIP